MSKPNDIDLFLQFRQTYTNYLLVSFIFTNSISNEGREMHKKLKPITRQTQLVASFALFSLQVGYKCEKIVFHLIGWTHVWTILFFGTSRAEEFGQNYEGSAATSVDKSENSLFKSEISFSYIILR